MIGVFIRLRIEETPDFKRVLRDGNVSRFPVIETICSHPKDLIIGLGARITEISWIYVLTVFGLSYAVTNLGLSLVCARSYSLRRRGGADYNTATSEVSPIAWVDARSIWLDALPLSVFRSPFFGRL